MFNLEMLYEFHIVADTFVGKTDDLTVVQWMVSDCLHKGGKQ